jgi:hypothetical protein
MSAVDFFTSKVLLGGLFLSCVYFTVLSVLRTASTNLVPKVSFKCDMCSEKILYARGTFFCVQASSKALYVACRMRRSGVTINRTLHAANSITDLGE